MYRRRLTMAYKQGPKAVIDCVERTFAEWNDGDYAWPDSWHDWNRAHDDALTELAHQERYS